MKTKNKLLMFITGCLGFLTGCGSTSATYQSVLNQSQHELANIGDAASEMAAMTFGEILYNFALSAKEFAPGVITGSIAVGIILLAIVRKERTWRKHIVVFFIILVPLLMFLLSYGLAILVSVYQF